MRAIALTACLAALWACGPFEPAPVPPIALEGSVSQGLNAVALEARDVGRNGVRTALGRTEVDAEGRYRLRVTTGDGLLLLEAFDATGAVVGRSMPRATSASDVEGAALQKLGEGEIDFGPEIIDTESTLEADLALQIVERGTSPAEVDLVDLDLRVDPRFADAFRAELAARPDEAQRTLRAVAQAVVVAQAADAAWHARHGALPALVRHERAMARARLVREGTSSAATLGTALALVDARFGIDAAEHARLVRATDVVALQTVDAFSRSPTLREALARTAAVREARLAVGGLDDVLTEHQAPAELRGEAAQAGATLVGALEASASPQERLAAFSEWRRVVRGTTSLEPSVLSKSAHATGAAWTIDDLATTVELCRPARATLDGEQRQAFDRAYVNGALSLQILALATVDAWQGYEGRVTQETMRHLGWGLERPEPQAAVLPTRVLLLTEGSVVAD